MIPSTNVYHRSNEIRYRAIGNEGVVVHQRQGEIVVVNEVGARLLQLLDSDKAIDELVDALAREFDVERPQLEQDVLVFVDELEQAGIVIQTAAGNESTT